MWNLGRMCSISTIALCAIWAVGAPGYSSSADGSRLPLIEEASRGPAELAEALQRYTAPVYSERQPSSSVPLGRALLSVPFSFHRGRPGACVDCSACAGGHRTYEGDTLSIYQPGFDAEETGGVHDCQLGTCLGFHEWDCTPTQHEDEEQEEQLLETLGSEELEALRVAMIVGDMPTIVELAAHPRVELVAERGAIQLLGCRGDVVAHLPLTPEVTRSLESSLTRRASESAPMPRLLR
jgi:hypothetical protein